VVNKLTRFERFTVFKPPALPEVFDLIVNDGLKQEKEIYLQWGDKIIA